MSDVFEIDDDGIITFKNGQKQEKTKKDELMAEYAALEHDVVNSIAHHTDDPVKVARYHELRKILGIPDTKDVFNQASNFLTELSDKTKESDDKHFWDLVADFKNRNGGKK